MFLHDKGGRETARFFFHEHQDEAGEKETKSRKILLS